jgi:hypothetical protein
VRGRPVATDHGLEGVLGIVVVSPHPLERNYLIVHSGERFIEELLVVSDCCLAEGDS